MGEGRLTAKTQAVCLELGRPGAPLTYFNDGGGSNRGSYFIPQKIPNSEFVYPKKPLLFLAYPKKSFSVFASANVIIYLLES